MQCAMGRWRHHKTVEASNRTGQPCQKRDEQLEIAGYNCACFTATAGQNKTGFNRSQSTSSTSSMLAAKAKLNRCQVSCGNLDKCWQTQTWWFFFGSTLAHNFQHNDFGVKCGEGDEYHYVLSKEQKEWCHTAVHTWHYILVSSSWVPQEQRTCFCCKGQRSILLMELALLQEYCKCLRRCSILVSVRLSSSYILQGDCA